MSRNGNEPVPRTILDWYELSGEETGNLQVRCVFHDDANPSMSLNLERGAFQCFSCKESGNLARLAERISEASSDEELAPSTHEVAVATLPPVISPEEGAKIQAAEAAEYPTAEEYLRDRGITDFAGLACEVGPRPDTGAAGYLLMGEDNGPPLVGRNLGHVTVDGGPRPRYWTNPAHKGPIWIRRPDSPEAPVWMTESLIDGMTLAQALPGEAVAASPGSTVGRERLFPLKDRTVFFVFDPDLAGWDGAKKAKAEIEAFGGNALVLELPLSFGDLNDAWVNRRDELVQWLDKAKGQFNTHDEDYVERLFSSSTPLFTVPTGIPTWDKLLGGGFASGAHVIGAEPKVGKTSIAVQFADRAVERGLRVLLVTYEVVKSQYYARQASRHCDLAWNVIERHPQSVPRDVVEKIKKKARLLRIGSGWEVAHIKYVAKDFDVVIVDYLQRMPAHFDGPQDSPQNLSWNISQLSDLGRDGGKIVLVISSLSRAAYGGGREGGDISLKDFKGSGNIEYVAQSATGLRRSEGSDRVYAKVVANTRGMTGRWYMQADLAHQRFEETTVLHSTAEPTQKKGALQVDLSVLKSKETE